MESFEMEYFMKLMGIVDMTKKVNAKPGQVVRTFFSSLLGLEIYMRKDYRRKYHGHGKAPRIIPVCISGKQH